MSDITNPLGGISYTNKDFESIYPELLDVVKKLTYRWDPSVSNESDPGVLLLKLNAIIADKCNYNIDSNILECFPETVSQLSNARQLFAQLGYFMHWYNSATSSLSLKYVGNQTDIPFYTIPKFTMVTDSERSAIYTIVGNDGGDNKLTVSDIQLPTDGTAITAKIIQGVAINYSINGDRKIDVSHLDTNNRLYFDTNLVPENGVFITNADNSNYSDWVRKDNLLVEEPGQTIYKFGTTYDGSYCYIEFPEDAETILKNGINITYIKTSGLAGNIAANVLTNFYYTFSPEEDASVVFTTNNVKLLNIYSAVDGSDPETIEDGYKNYKKTIGTFNTLITLRDYLHYILRSELVSNGFVCDRTNDVQSTYNILTMNDSLVSSVHMIEDDALPGYLYDGVFYRGNAPLGTPEYYSAYTAEEIGSNRCLDLSTGTTYILSNGSFVETSSEDVMNAFSIKLYMLQYMPSVSSAIASDATFNMLTNKQTETLKDYLDDIKSLQHDLTDLKAPSTISSNICFFKNKYPIELTITTQYPLSTAEANELIINVKSALYESLNAKEVEFGKEIQFDDVFDIVKNSDKRIKNINLSNIEYTTYAVYYEPTLDGISNPFVEVEINTQRLEDSVTIDPHFASAANNDAIIIDQQQFLDRVGDTNYAPITFAYTSPNWQIKTTGSSATTTDPSTLYGIAFKHTEVFTSTSDQTEFEVTASITKVVDVLRNNVSLNGAYTFENDTTNSTYTVILNSAVSAGQIITITYWSSAPIEAFTTGDIFNVRISYKTQFQDEIFTKSVLAGRTPLLVKADEFKYKWNQRQLLPTDTLTRLSDMVEDNVFIKDISHIRTNVDIAMSNEAPSYQLRDNESLQFYSPNLIDDTSYSNYVKFEFVTPSEKTIIQDSVYQLQANEYIFFYWKETDQPNETYSFSAYGPGNIISPSFSLNSSTDSYGYSTLASLLTESNNYRADSSRYPMPETLSSDITVYLTAVSNILSNTKTITIKNINQITLSPTDGVYFYWILNETTNDMQYYQLPVNNSASSIENDRILDAGEYFIYSDSNLSDMSILGFGTRIHIVDTNPNITSWKVKVLDSSLVLNSGISALTNYWKQIPASSSVTVTENQFVTVNEGCTVTLSADNMATWNRTFNRTGVFGSETTSFSGAVTSSSATTALEFTSGTTVDTSSIVVKVNDTILDSSNWTYTEPNVVISSGFTSGDIVTITYTYGASYTDLTDLNGFTISYTTPYDSTPVTLPILRLQDIFGNEISWSGQSLLSLVTSPTEEQPLLAGQSIQFMQVGDTDFDDGDPTPSSHRKIITGENISQRTSVSDPEYLTWNYYPVVVSTSIAISSDGSNDRFPTYIVDAEGNRTYLTIFLHMTKFDAECVKYSEDSVQFTLLQGKHALDFLTNFTFLVPKGPSLIEFTQTEDLTDSLTIALGGNTLYPLGASSPDISAKKTYYLTFDSAETVALRFGLTLGGSDTGVVAPRDLHFTFRNLFKFKPSDNITKEYYNRILKLIQRYDPDNVFNYTYQVNEDDLIEDPLNARAFLNPKHIFNQATICQLDTSDPYPSITVQGKKK